MNQEITDGPERERIAAEKRQALEQWGHKQPPNRRHPAAPQRVRRQAGARWRGLRSFFVRLYRQNSKEQNKHGHCVLKIGDREELLPNNGRSREAKLPKNNTTDEPNLDDPTDTKRYPNQAYNGQLPYPIPPRTKKYAGEYEGTLMREVVGKVRVIVFPTRVYGKFKWMRQGWDVRLPLNKLKGETPRRYEGQWPFGEKR